MTAAVWHLRTRPTCQTTTGGWWRVDGDLVITIGTAVPMAAPVRLDPPA